MLDPAIGKRISAFLVTVALSVPLLTGTALAETVRMWTFLNPDGKAGREQVLKTLIANFEAAHPGTKIEVEPQNYQTMVDKFYAAHQTKTAPDVMFIYTSRLFDGIKIGAFANLNELFVKNWSAEDVADVDGAFWRYGATPTARYQVTISPTVICQFYRTDLFAEAGIDPKSLNTWEKLIDAAQKLTTRDAAGTVARWGFGQSFIGAQPIAPIVFSTILDMDGALFDKNLRAKWSTPGGIKGLQMQVDMMRKYKVTPESATNMVADDLFDQFNGGRYAIIRGSATRIGTAMGILGPGKVGCLPTPSFTEGKRSPVEVAGWSLVVWSGSKVKDIAGKWVEYMSSREADTLWSTKAGIMPIRKSTVAANAEFFADPKNAYLVDVAADSRENGWLPPEDAASGFDEGLNSALQNVMTNGIDPKVALERAEAAYNRANRR